MKMFTTFFSSDSILQKTWTRSASGRFAIRLTNVLAPVMFFASLIFLLGLAILVVYTVDVPRVESLKDAVALQGRHRVIASILIFLSGLWGIFFAELVLKKVISRRLNSRLHWLDYAVLLCPPLRLALPNAQMNGRCWLPILGWQIPGKRLFKKLERKFSTPMLLIALLILPVLLVEFKFQSQIESRPWLQSVLHFGTGLIWYAFAAEFLIMVSATDRRLDYVKKNWIDLAIILLPFISFLCSLRIFRAARIAKFAKLQQLTKMTRVYRMRGLIAKSMRALLLLEIVHRVLKTKPENRLAKLELQFADKQEELRELERQIEALKKEMQTDAKGAKDLKSQASAKLEQRSPSQADEQGRSQRKAG